MVKCTHIDIFSALKTSLAMSLKTIGVLLTFLGDAFSFRCREKITRKLLITKEKPFREINRQLETKKTIASVVIEGYNPIKS